MTTEKPDSADYESPAGAEAEYNGLRGEILLRIQQRHQIVAGTLALGGVFLGVGLTNPPIGLVYPPLAAFLALAWAQNDFRIRQIARFIRDHIEPLLPGARWESHLDSIRADPALRKKFGSASWRFVVLSHGGLFLVTQAMALYVGLSWLLVDASDSPDRTGEVVAWSLAALDVLSILGVVWIVLRARR